MKLNRIEHLKSLRLCTFRLAYPAYTAAWRGGLLKASSTSGSGDVNGNVNANADVFFAGLPLLSALRWLRCRHESGKNLHFTFTLRRIYLMHTTHCYLLFTISPANLYLVTTKSSAIVFSGSFSTSAIFKMKQKTRSC